MSVPLVVFDLLIPRTDDRTGVVHPPSLFDRWTIETAELFGGVSLLAADILGFWFDSKDLVEDHSHWYRVAVREADVPALRECVRATALRFGQRCLYLQKSGDAELVWAEPA
jgi:hypothetical protein